MQPNISFKFIPPGQSYTPSDKKSEVVLDVGGQNEGHFFDHHFPGGPGDCAALLVLNNKDRLNDLLPLQNVTIVIHREPDFDCACAAWLVSGYLWNKGSFPEGSEWVAQYAMIVDSGKLNIKKEFFLVPASVLYGFYRSAEKNKDLDTLEKRDRWILERAFDLMSWCAKNLSAGISIGNDDEKIFDLMKGSGVFEPEYQLLKEDRLNYDNDLADNRITEKIDQFLVYNKLTCGVECVRALIFRQCARSSLTKYWARNDGYIVTLIPLACDGWGDVLWKPEGFAVKPNRVIISIPPELPFSLQQLAVQLERAECEAERQLLGDKAELKRTRTVIRRGYEDAKWVTNNDPWYDGSSHNYTIVDSPSSLSLLSTERIKKIALNYTLCDITSARITVICPLSLKTDGVNSKISWENVLAGVNGSGSRWSLLKREPGEKTHRGDVTGYLYDSVRRFLNLDYSGHRETAWYENTVDTLHIVRSDAPDTNGTRYIFPQLETVENIRSPKNDFHTFRLVNFGSKIGFLILSVDLREIMSHDIQKILSGINERYPDFLSLLSLSSDNIECKEPVFMAFAEFNGDKINNIDIGQDVFSACSFLDPTIPSTDGSSERARMEKMLLRITAGTLFGFSRNCTVFGSIARPILHAEAEKQDGNRQETKRSHFIDAYYRRFNEPWLYEWIVALHQHWVLIDMKTRLGTVGINERRSLSRLQSEFVEFTADACFTEVTSDPIGAELYNKWKELLSFDDLNQEVNSQIDALNNRVTSSIKGILGIITFVFFPLSLIVAILAFFQFTDMSEMAVLTKLVILGSLIVLCIVIWYVISYFSEKKMT
ncbi:MAG: hypothetical protein EH225_11650 [Calditrichaeota bacterium]|nr:MAG: hypothetical protein EH225_11650 [Calditrichota bacterium]